MRGTKRNFEPLDPKSAQGLLAKVLCEWRRANSMPLKQVARELGVAESTWNRWENGSRFPSPHLLALLADYIKVPVCHFFYLGGKACSECRRNETERNEKRR